MEIAKATNYGKLWNCLATNEEYHWLVPVTVSDAQQGTQISVIKQSDDVKLDVLISKLVIDAVEFYGGIESKYIKMIVSQIKLKYWFFNLEEVAMIFQRALSGQYKIYGKLTPAMIMEWFHEYDTKERMEYFQSQSAVHKESNEKYFEEQETEHRRDRLISFKQQYEKQKIYQEAKDKVKNN